MVIFEKLPYTNYHNLNADWIVKKVKEVAEAWTEYREDMDEWKGGVDTELQTFYNWFDNLDLTDEVRTIIEEMVQDGSFITTATPVITSATEDWLAAHVSQGYAVDNTLTISGAAADAKVTGDRITQLKEDLGELTGNVCYSYTKDASVSNNAIPTQAAEANWESVVVECTAGDIFYVKGWGGNSTRLWMFGASDGTVITQSATALHMNDLIPIVAPENTRYLCVNSMYTQIEGVLIGNSFLRDDIALLNSEVEANNTTILELVNKWNNLFDKDAAGIANGKLWNGVVDTNDAFRTSDYIEIKKSGYYVISGIAFNSYGEGSYNQSVACYDNSKQFLYNADCTLLSDSGYSRPCKFSLASNVKYIRFTIYTTELANTMMFDGQTLPDEYIPFGTTIHINETVVQADNLNPLTGKVAVFDGDSICTASTDRSNKGSYAGRIGDANGLIVHNEGVSGGTITVVPSIGHNLSSYIDTIHTLYPDLDYLILEGGVNDSNLMGDIRGGATPEGFGSYNMHDFSGNYDSTKFCGAVETLFYKAINYYTGKKIGFIIAPKFGRQVYDYTPENSNLSAYFEVVKAICKKWGIPYLDLWNNCHMNPKLTACYDYTMTDDENVLAGKLYLDGGHPAPAGYNYMAPIIGEWMKSL